MSLTITRGLIASIAAVMASVFVATDVQAVETQALTTAAPVSMKVIHDEVVPAGTTTRVYVIAGVSIDGSPKLQKSTDDGATWATTSTVITMIDGYGTGKWAPTDDAWYRVHGDGVTTDKFHIDVQAISGAAISAGASTYQFRWGEMVWLESYAVRSGAAPGSIKVAYERSSSATGSWTRLGSVTTSESGYSGYRIRPTADAWYRAVVLDGAGTVVAASTRFKVDAIAGDTTLEERRSSLAWNLGKATTGITKISASDLKAAKYTGGATAARYQKFEGGTLVEVTQPGKIRTWLVYSRQLLEYKARGGWGGKLGLPERDVRCGLPEGGCLQLFSGGSIYTNTSSMSPGRYVAYGRTIQTEIIAAAVSQKGYEEPSWRESKYNTWIGGTSAWCAVFVSWAAYASGHSGDVPKDTTFPKFLSTVKKSPALKKNPSASTLRAGDVLIFDWGTGTPSHAGFVLSVSGSWVYTIEGNTTDGSGDPQRGVYARKRPLSGVWAYFHPSDY